MKGSLSLGTEAVGIAVKGNYAYVANGAAGLKVINISNPISPSLVGTSSTPGSATDVAIAGNYAYVADYTAGLQVFDISVPSNPSWVGGYNTPGLAEGVAIVGDYAYISDESAGVQIIDIKDPMSPILVGTYDTPGLAYDVAVVGNYAYVADHDAGLHIIDGIGEGKVLSGTPTFYDLGTLSLKATANDGSESVSTPFSINVLESITNHKPTVTNGVYQTSKDVGLQFSKDAFIATFQDDDSNELSKIQITGLPDYGELKLSGVAVLLNQEIGIEDINDLSFTPQTDWTGTTTFDWRGFDGITYSDEAVITINTDLHV